MTDQHALDTAWRTHDALRDWTGKVDAKASFALTIESAVLGAIVALSAKSGRLSTLHGGHLLAFRVGVGMLGLAVLAAVGAVIPQIRRGATKSEWSRHFIFFGHVRHWSADDLVVAWRDQQLLPVLAHQAVAMSKIAWRKHRLLQFSLASAVLGTGAVVGAAVFR